MESLEFKTKLVGPDEARELLKINTHNRPVSLKNVNWIVSEINKGNWKNTGDTIKISRSGNLIDGQHRLHAIIKSGKTVEVNFCVGVDDDSFAVIDTGKQRSSSDILGMSGHSDTLVLSASIQLILLIKSGKLMHKERSISNTETLAFAKTCSELPEIIAYIKKHNRKFRMVSDAVAASLYYLFAQRNQEATDLFFDQYWYGMDLEDKSPVKLLREKFINNSIKKTKMNRLSKIVYIAHCFNLFTQNRKLSRLEVDITKFPVLL